MTCRGLVWDCTISPKESFIATWGKFSVELWLCPSGTLLETLDDVSTNGPFLGAVAFSTSDDKLFWCEQYDIQVRVAWCYTMNSATRQIYSWFIPSLNKELRCDKLGPEKMHLLVGDDDMCQVTPDSNVFLKNKY